MKIGILSDTHLTAPASDFRRVVESCFADVDMIIHAGDMTGRGVFDYLSNWNLKAVRGNMDDFDLFDILPTTRVEEIMGQRVGIIHGKGPPEGIEDVVLRGFDDVDIIIFGHSHVPVQMTKRGVLLFNPGSYHGRYGYKGSVGIAEIDKTVTFRHIEL